MNRLDLLQGQQKNHDFYVTLADPRLIARLMDLPKDGEVAKAQRPLKISKVKEISRYAAGKYVMSEGESSPESEHQKAMGIIPNCPILNVKLPLQIQKDGRGYFINVPELAKGLGEYAGSVECIDGQHRLAAFRDEYIDADFPDSESYLMGFSVFENLQIDEKREIFMVSNEKQDRVEPNLLRKFKRELGLLSEDDQAIYDLLEKLNVEDLSILKGRITIGSQTVKNGLKLEALTGILVRSKAYEELKKVPEKDRFKYLCIYLKAWSAAFPGMFNNPKHTLGKVAGIRFAFYLQRPIAQILERTMKKYTADTLKNVLDCLYDLMINQDSLFEKGTLAQGNFRSESGIVSLANSYAATLEKELVKDSFDIYSSPSEA